MSLAYTCAFTPTLVSDLEADIISRGRTAREARSTMHISFSTSRTSNICITPCRRADYLFIRNNDDALPEVLPHLHVQYRLPRVLEPAHDVLLVPDLPARDARRDRLHELREVLGLERDEEEAVQRDLAPEEQLQVLDAVRRRRVVRGDVAADLRQWTWYQHWEARTTRRSARELEGGIDIR